MKRTQQQIEAAEQKELMTLLDEVPRKTADLIIPIIQQTIAAEREACAKVAEAAFVPGDGLARAYIVAKSIAAAIRAREDK